MILLLVNDYFEKKHSEVNGHNRCNQKKSVFSNLITKQNFMSN